MLGSCIWTGAGADAPQVLGAGSSGGAALGGLWGFPALPLGRDLSSPGGVRGPRLGCSSWRVSDPSGFQPGCVVSLQSDAGSGSAG